MIWGSVARQNWQVEQMELLLNTMGYEGGKEWCMVDPEMIG
jgi:hypothetical protein